jgi:hypothetical protein
MRVNLLPSGLIRTLWDRSELLGCVRALENVLGKCQVTCNQCFVTNLVTYFFLLWAGNPQDVLKSIADRHKLEPTGEPSLQNAIEMARGSMKYLSNPLYFSLTY